MNLKSFLVNILPRGTLAFVILLEAILDVYEFSSI